MTRRLSILGCTGSIGQNTLDLVRRFPEQFSVAALCAGENDALLSEQVLEFKPEIVSVGSEQALARLKARLPDPPPCELLWGSEGACAVASAASADTVVSAIVGSAGLLPTYTAITQGKRLALANKESLVIAGSVMTEAARRHAVEILPVDSEHSAIFQCLKGHDKRELSRIYLTASGGPFLNRPIERMADISVQEALDHPTWKMGPKISIDSATLMNKGLEAIEARWLFDVRPEQIEPVIHPTSYVHSMVAFVDGSIIAQVGQHDMRGPIAYALAYPQRLRLPFNQVHPADLPPWEFKRPNPGQFPCLGLAFEAMSKGAGYPAVLNGANEEAVQAFLERRIPFMGIATINAQTLELACAQNLADRVETIDDVMEIDRQARRMSRRLIVDLFG
jgi:1-deoxy-D-xylulose-5-phosphate reductoisomerase